MNASLSLPLDPISASAAPTRIEDKALTGQIVRRLGNRVRNLRVLRQFGGLVIQGRTTTYYVKQLAQHAAMELDSDPILANDIEVS